MGDWARRRRRSPPYPRTAACDSEPRLGTSACWRGGLALAAIAELIERPETIPKGEVARLLTLLAETPPGNRAGRRTCSLLYWFFPQTGHVYVFIGVKRTVGSLDV